jgi:hypothetical protein
LACRAYSCSQDVHDELLQAANTVTGMQNKSLSAALGNIECMIARLKAGATLV